MGGGCLGVDVGEWMDSRRVVRTSDGHVGWVGWGLEEGSGWVHGMGGMGWRLASCCSEGHVGVW